MTVTPAAITAAAEMMRGVLVETPCVASAPLSDLSGADVVVKFENNQVTGSFKSRGALVKLESIAETGGVGGVVAMSAGNHAQGVGYHARRLGLAATIVMPRWTPFSKIQRTEATGAEVVLHGDTVADAGRHAQELANRNGWPLIHPFDDDSIIAGQGTVAGEMLIDVPDLEVLIVPVGGGGLIAGCAVAAKHHNPDIEVIGVQSAMYPSLAAPLRGVSPKGSGVTIADGIAVQVVGTRPLEVARNLVDDVLVVGDADIEQAIFLFLELEKSVVEGAGAAPLAALLAASTRFAGRRVGLIASGGNIDSRLLASVITRGLVRGGRIVNLRIETHDAPGQLARVASLIADAAGNIVEVHHQRLFSDIPARTLELDVMVEIRDAGHTGKIVTDLERCGYRVRVLATTEGGA
jgi:threonine dehydratase